MTPKTNNSRCCQQAPPPLTLPPVPSTLGREFMPCLTRFCRQSDTCQHKDLCAMQERVPAPPCGASAAALVRMDLTDRSAPNHTFLFSRPLLPCCSWGIIFGYHLGALPCASLAIHMSQRTAEESDAHLLLVRHHDQQELTDGGTLAFYPCSVKLIKDSS